MPQARLVKRITNAILRQQRLIVHLECGHNLSVTQRHITDSGQGLEYFLSADQAMCPTCPDPPPEEPRRLKSAHQLWKEAGEP